MPVWRGCISRIQGVQKGVQPLDCIKMVAAMNPYGHPHEETLERLEEAGAKVLRTDELGAVRIVVRNKCMEISGYVKRGVVVLPVIEGLG